jgi:stage III sporulation protein AG
VWLRRGPELRKLGQWLGRLLGQDGKQPLGEGERKLLSNLLVVGLAGLIVMLSLGFFGQKKPQEKFEEPKVETKKSPLLDKATERELADILSKIRGAGQVTVAITLEGGPRREYAANRKETVKTSNRDQQSSQETTVEEQKVLARKDGMREEPILERELQPAVQGVLIVAQGAADLLVAEKLTQAAATFLGIGTNRIVVMEGN